MKTFALILVLIIWSLNLLAAAPGAPFHWLATTPRSMGQSHFSSIHIYTNHTTMPWEVGTVQVSIIKAKTSDSLHDVVSAFKQTYPDVQWNISQSHHAIQLEGRIDAENRIAFIRMRRHQQDSIFLTTSMIRPVMWSSLKKSIHHLGHSLEQQWIASLDRRTTRWSLFNSAYAQGRNFPNIPGNIPGLGPLIDGLNNLNDQLDDANDNWNNSNQNWSDSNQNWSDSNKNWADSNVNWNNTNNNWQETNRLLDTVLDKAFDTKFMAMHGAVVGAATAAGAALGGWLAHQAINGAVALVKKLISTIDKRQLYWDDFKQARAEYVKMKSAMGDIERKMDATLSLIARSQDISPANLLILMEKELAFFQVMKKQLETQESKDRDQGDFACAVLMQQGINVIDLEINNLNKALEFYRADASFRPERDHFFCQLLADIVAQINRYNYEMNSHRIDLLAGAKEWMRHARKEHVRVKRKLRRISIGYNQMRIAQLGDRLVSKIHGESLRNERLTRREFMNLCRQGKGPIGEAVLAKVREGKKGERFVGGLCRKAFGLYEEQVLSVKQDEFNLLVAQVHMSLNDHQMDQLGNHLESNLESELAMVKHMSDWFSDLRQEMHCLSNYHDPNVLQGCRQNYPELMGPVLQLKRAQAQMEERGCARKYYEAAQSMSGLETQQQIANQL